MPPVNLRDLLWLGDMGKDEFKFVSSKLGHEYMSVTTEEPTFPVHGMVYGFVHGRKMVNMIVQRGNIRINIPFVLDGGSPVNVISDDALAAFKVNPKNIVNEINLNVHGFESVPFVHAHSDGRLRDVNILGWLFFLSTGAFERLQAKEFKVSLFKNEAQYLEVMKKENGGQL
jgi:hypothetical protein